MPGTIKNLAQFRAQFAYTEIKAAIDMLSLEKRKEFKSHIKDVPMMIKTNGLAAAYAFVFSKKDKEDYRKITEITKKWLVVEQRIFILAANESFYEKLVQLDSDQYRKSLREILALFTWLKRFADGLID